MHTTHATDMTPDDPPARRRRWPRRLLIAAVILGVAVAALAVVDAVMRSGAEEPEPALRCVEEEGLFSLRATAPVATPDPEDPLLVTFTVGVEITNTSDESVELMGVDVVLANEWELYAPARGSHDSVDLAAGATHDVTASLMLPFTGGLPADEWPTEVARITPQWLPIGAAMKC